MRAQARPVLATPSAERAGEARPAARVPVPWESPRSNALRFWLPVGALVAGILVTALILRSPSTLWGFLAVYHAPFGAYTAVPAARALGFSAGFVLAFMAYLRVFGALFFVWNMHWLRAVPWLGPRLVRVEAKGHAVWLRRPWMRRAGLVGLALFVFTPFAGTGLVTGSMIGRISGFSWLPAWIAITTGALAQMLALTLVFYAGVDLLLF